MVPSVSILWFRRDLRLTDNSALEAALAKGQSVLPLYILDEAPDRAWQMGGAGRWWLHHSLAALDQSLRRKGSRLIVLRGIAETVIADLAARLPAQAVVMNRTFDPPQDARDEALALRLRAQGIACESFNSSLLYQPGSVRTRAGLPFQIFTPFWRACQETAEPERPRPAPDALPAPADWPESLDLAALDLLPRRPDWALGWDERWQCGEEAAAQRFADFLDDGLDRYHMMRDRPDCDGTSRLSPHLHFGEIGPRQVWHGVRLRGEAGAAGAETYLKEIGWREFYHHLLVDFPDLPQRPMKAEFDRFPWAEDESPFAAWTQGRTGFPIVDAGMRCLWQTGWMHNRVRMITASFLVKDLLLPWFKGEEWFWDTLVDADLASNAGGWQWVAGCAGDAAPYFRVFNPVLQGEKFDPRGHYVRRWVPELANLPDLYIHKPWEAPRDVLDRAGLRLGETYPAPMVDHGAARRRALQAYGQIKGAA